MIFSIVWTEPTSLVTPHFFEISIFHPGCQPSPEQPVRMQPGGISKAVSSAVLQKTACLAICLQQSSSNVLPVNMLFLDLLSVLSLKPGRETNSLSAPFLMFQISFLVFLAHTFWYMGQDMTSRINDKVIVFVLWDL